MCPRASLQGIIVYSIYSVPKLLLLLTIQFSKPNLLHGSPQPSDPGNDTKILMGKLAVSLSYERNPFGTFESIKVSTKVPSDWASLPKRSSVLLKPHLNKEAECTVKLEMKFLHYERTHGTLCLFQSQFDPSVFSEGVTMEIGKSILSASDLFEAIKPVTGYVLGEKVSLVAGYLIDGYFYGTVRLLDKFRMHFIAFYIEPYGNIPLYDKTKRQTSKSADDNGNAILYEYINDKKYDQNENFLEADAIKKNGREKFGIRGRGKKGKGNANANDLDIIETTVTVSPDMNNATAKPVEGTCKRPNHTLDSNATGTIKPATITIINATVGPADKSNVSSDILTTYSSSNIDGLKYNIYNNESLTVINIDNSIVQNLSIYQQNAGPLVINAPHQSVTGSLSTSDYSKLVETSLENMKPPKSKYGEGTDEEILTIINIDNSIRQNLTINQGTRGPIIINPAIIPSNYTLQQRSSASGKDGKRKGGALPESFYVINIDKSIDQIITVNPIAQGPIIINCPYKLRKSTNDTLSGEFSIYRSIDSNNETKIILNYEVLMTPEDQYEPTDDIVVIDDSIKQTIIINAPSQRKYDIAVSADTRPRESQDFSGNTTNLFASTTRNHTLTEEVTIIFVDKSTSENVAINEIASGPILINPPEGSKKTSNLSYLYSGEYLKGDNIGGYFNGTIISNQSDRMGVDQQKRNTSALFVDKQGKSSILLMDFDESSKQNLDIKNDKSDPLLVGTEAVSKNNSDSSTDAATQGDNSIGTGGGSPGSVTRNTENIDIKTTREYLSRGVKDKGYGASDLDAVITNVNSPNVIIVDNSIVESGSKNEYIVVSPNSVNVTFLNITETNRRVVPGNQTEKSTANATQPVLNRSRRSIDPYISSKNGKRFARSSNSNYQTTNYLKLEDLNDDLVGEVKFKSEQGSTNIFDTRRDEAFVCNLCVWVQPNFAAKFSLAGDVTIGVSELVEIIRLMSWIFRSMDFNYDKIPDPILLEITKVIVSEIKLPFNPLGSEVLADFSKNMSLSDGSPINMEIGVLLPNETLPLLQTAFTTLFSRQRCCAALAFVFHELPTVLSATTLRGLCSTQNVALITGFQDGHKVTQHDIYRASVHAMLHLLGAKHDQTHELDCVDKTMHSFINPFIMEPNHLLNVGIRTNSMRISYCTKIQIALFLSSANPSCMSSKKDLYCGNGVLDAGEECDCGAPWQCILREQCCGLRDSFSPCKIIKILSNQTCHRPYDW